MQDFDVSQFDMNFEQRVNAIGEWVRAAIKVTVGDEKLISAAEGRGQVNAPDPRAAQGSRQIRDLLSKRSISPATRAHPDADTEAVARVLIESEDENGEHCTTIVVSPNIIDASL